MGFRDNVLPLNMGLLAGRLDRQQYQQHFRYQLLMLVAVYDDEDLLLGLEELIATDGRAWFARPETTVTTMTVSPGTPQLRDLGSVMPARFDGAALRARVGDRLHFAVPLQKRPGTIGTDAERISVGRLRDNDIVLAHRSVSKLHAVLEHDERERLYLADEGSTNFTRVRGRIVDLDTTVTFGIGDVVQFGDIETMVVDPEVLWEAFQDD